MKENEEFNEAVDEAALNESVEVDETAKQNVENNTENSSEILDGDVEEAVDEVQARIKTLEQQASDNLDKYQRVFAEFDNFRKRTSREKASMYDDGVRDTVEKLLMVVDNLERAIAAKASMEDAENDSFYKGVNMTLKQFQDIFKSIGVEEIAAMGEQFDPDLHAAVAHEDDENYGANEIVLEMLKGYKYKNKVIRHSMVKVVN